MIIEKPSDILWNGKLYEEDWTSYYRMIHCPNVDLKAHYYPEKQVLKMWIKENKLTTIPFLGVLKGVETIELPCPARGYAEYYIMWVYNTLNYIKKFI